MSRQSRSRSRGWPLPLGECDPLVGRELVDEGRVVGSAPSSSTEQSPIPYALRRARLTARVSATRISAPRTTEETFAGSASPYPTKPFEFWSLYTTARKTQRFASGSESRSSRYVLIPQHCRRAAR